MKEHIELILKALENMKGDDTARARMAFSRFSYNGMQEQHGMSGKTRAEILEMYEAHDRKINKTISWFKNLVEVRV